MSDKKNAGPHLQGGRLVAVVGLVILLARLLRLEMNPELTLIGVLSLGAVKGKGGMCVSSANLDVLLLLIGPRLVRRKALLSC